MKIAVHFLLLLAFTFAALPGWADLTGTQVTGGLGINDPAHVPPHVLNFFDPNNGFVPAGFKNDAGTTITIGPGPLDFGADVRTDNFTANFTGDQLTVTEEEIGIPSPPWVMAFTDSAFAGVTITKVFDNFDHGGITFKHIGDEIILTRNFDHSPDDHYAIFDIGSPAPPPVPEPGSLLLLGTGLLGAAGALRRKFVAR